MRLVSLICRDMEIPESDVKNVLISAPYRYKRYTVPKRSGKGTREIAQPSREVKLLQRWAISKMRHILPVHSAATAYEPGASIVNNARLHADSRYILKMDFKDFFPSIGEETLRAHFRNYMDELNDLADLEDMDLLIRLFLKRSMRKKQLEMAIGAPSSPFLANSVMFSIDEKIAIYCKKQGTRYTRYSDDLTFSVMEPGILRKVEKDVRSLVHTADYPKLRFNSNKTIHVSKAVRRVVTGLILTPDGKISIGRDKKRELRATLHAASLDKLSDDELQRLRGYLAFARNVEPTFYLAMLKRYGDKIHWLAK